MITRMAAAFALVAVSACATAGQPVPAGEQASGRTCDESSIQDFVGRQRGPQVEAELLEASRAAVVRWVPQGTAVTMEYRSDRVTAHLDSNDRIESISCS